MRVLILGAGQVGSTVAETLVDEENDVTIVDSDAVALQALEDRLDLRAIQGHAANPAVLEAAGARQADMLLAVTSNDETNMVACQIAYALFHTPTRIARVRQQAYLEAEELFERQAFHIDVLINPEQLVTDYIQKLILYPGSLQVLDFADGRVKLVAMHADEGGPMVGSRLAAIREHIPKQDTRVAAIYRDGESISPTGDTVIEANDEVFFLAAKPDIRKVMSEFAPSQKSVKRVVIAGGGNIGMRLAAALEGQYNVKLIERSVERAQYLAEELKNTLVFVGNGADEELLDAESIENTDVFCAVTNDEEANILSAMLAKRRGAKRVMAIINRASYVELVQLSDIDVAVSPKLATISRLLSHVRQGDVVIGHSLRRGVAEAIEAVAHGDAEHSQVVGKAIGDIVLPPGTTIGAVVREEQVLISHHDIVIQTGDHMILFMVDKRHIKAVEALFDISSPRKRRFF